MYFVEPSMAYYVDNSRDIVCGEALLCDYRSFVDGIETYYNNRSLMKKHGEASRKYILENLSWDLVVDKLYKIIIDIVLTQPHILDENGVPIKIDTIDPNIVDAVFGCQDKKLIKTGDITTGIPVEIKESIPEEIKEKSEEIKTPVKDSLSHLSKEELKAIREQLDLLLSKD